MRIQEGDRVRLERDRQRRNVGTVLEYSPEPGVELDVLVSWDHGETCWEPASILVTV
jgi:hypothetical protein